MRGPDPYSSDAYSSDANPQIDLTTPLPPPFINLPTGLLHSGKKVVFRSLQQVAAFEVRSLSGEIRETWKQQIEIRHDVGPGQ